MITTTTGVKKAKWLTNSYSDIILSQTSKITSPYFAKYLEKETNQKSEPQISEPQIVESLMQNLNNLTTKKDKQGDTADTREKKSEIINNLLKNYKKLEQKKEKESTNHNIDYSPDDLDSFIEELESYEDS